MRNQGDLIYHGQYDSVQYQYSHSHALCTLLVVSLYSLYIPDLECKTTWKLTCMQETTNKGYDTKYTVKYMGCQLSLTCLLGLSIAITSS